MSKATVAQATPAVRIEQNGYAQGEKEVIRTLVVVDKGSHAELQPPLLLPTCFLCFTCFAAPHVYAFLYN